MRPEDQDIARVSAVDRGSYLVRNTLREIPAELAGKFYFSVDSPNDLPCVGDWVAVRYHDDHTAAIIHGIFKKNIFTP